MLIGVIAQLVLQIILPVYLLYILLRTARLTPLSRHLIAGYSALTLVYVFLLARWDVTSVYLRYVWAVVFLIVIIRVYRVRLTRKTTDESKLSIAGNITLVVLGIAVIGFIAMTWTFRNEQAVSIASPLRGGDNYVAHGGANVLMNYHHSNQAQAYALDIGKVNQFGHQNNTGSRPESRKIFAAPVFSPCDGEVIESVRNLPDLRPPQRDSINKAGNHIVLQCHEQNVKIMLAHLKQDSLKVTAGKTVETGDELAQVGNSGNTTQPHLHIHAVPKDEDILKGSGVPLLIDGHFLRRNDIF